MVDSRAPILETPLSQIGKSQQPVMLSADLGVITAISDLRRPPNAAKVLDNLQMIGARNIWTSSGIGFTKANAAVFNGGGAFLDFAIYFDALGNQVLLAQIGDRVGYLSTDLQTFTALGAPLASGLSTTAWPTMRMFSPSAATSLPILLYCNGAIEPVKTYCSAPGAGAPAGAPDTTTTAGFSTGFFTETATISGTITAGDKITLTITSTSLIASPSSVVYTVVATDSTDSIASALAVLINSAGLAGVSATAAAKVVTVSYPSTWAAPTFSKVVSGAATEIVTLAAGVVAAGTWPGTFNSKQYTKPALCEPFGSRMAFGSFANTGTSGNRIVNDILISTLNNAETFQQSTPPTAADAIAFSYPAILGPLRGMRSFRLSNQTNTEILLCGCAKGMFMITGTDSTNYALTVLTREHGLMNNRSWVQVRNDLCYLSTSGIRDYNSLSINANLVNDQLSQQIKDLVQSIDQISGTNAVQTAHAFHNTITQEVQFWAPQTFDGGQPQHAFVMNYNNDASGTNDVVPIWSTKSGCQVQASIVFNGICYGGNAGFVQQHYNGNTYAGAAIAFQYVSALVSLGDLIQTHRSHHVVIATEGAYQQFSANAYAYEQTEEGGMQRSIGEPSQYQLTSGVLNVTTLGTWQLGFSSFPGVGVKTIHWDVSLHGVFSEYQLYSTSSSDALDFSGMQVVMSGGGEQH